MDSAVFSDKVTLPEHLKGRLQPLLNVPCATILPDKLKTDLQAIIDAAAELAADSLEGSAAVGENTEELEPVNEVGPSDHRGASVAELEPATVPYELLRRVSQWASKKDSAGVLRRASLDPAQYTLVSLLAGTEVYYPPKHRERLLVASSSTPSSFLPAYLNPPNPTLIQEYRSLARDLSTVLNVLFSTLGAGFAVFLAAKGGAGYGIDIAALLGIGTAVIVCLAEMGLLWIVGRRRDEERRRDQEVVAKVMRGSGALEPIKASSGEEAKGEASEASLASNPMWETESSAPATLTDKKNIRLRRREITTKETT